MSDERMRSLLDEWFEGTDPQPPNARRTASDVMARVPHTRQRGRWSSLRLFPRRVETPTATDKTVYQPSLIPATNGQTPTDIGRTQAMFSPAKAIIAGALAFGIGSVVLIAQPFGQRAGSVPGAATDAGPMEPVAFTARIDWWRDIGDATYEEVDGHNERRGVVEAPVITASDPRLEGRLTLSMDEDTYPTPEGTLTLGTSTWRLETDEGAWQGSHPYFYDTATLDDVIDATVVLVGEGVYAGQFAVFEISDTEIHGAIFPAGPPTAPAAPQSAE